MQYLKRQERASRRFHPAAFKTDLQFAFKKFSKLSLTNRKIHYLLGNPEHPFRCLFRIRELRGVESVGSVEPVVRHRRPRPETQLR